MGCCQKDEEITRMMEDVEDFFGIDLDEADSSTNTTYIRNWNFCEWRDDLITWVSNNMIIIGAGVVAVGGIAWWLNLNKE